jgi:hypothetical protein
LPQPVERALDIGDHGWGDVTVVRRRIYFGMAQQRLDLSDMGVVLDQVGGKAMALMPSSA